MLADTLNVPVRQAKLPQNVGNRRTAAPPALQNDDLGRIGAGAEIRIYLYNAHRVDAIHCGVITRI